MDSRVKTFVAEKIGQRSKSVGGQVLATAGTLRSIAEQLRADSLMRGTADLLNVGAAKTEHIGHYLSDSTFDVLVGDAGKYSRKRPWIVVLGGLLVGLTASRIMKAGAARREFYSPPTAAAQPGSLIDPSIAADIAHTTVRPQTMPVSDDFHRPE